MQYLSASQYTPPGLYWYHCMDAYFFTSKNVDWRIEDFTKTFVPFAYTIQSGYSMELILIWIL